MNAKKKREKSRRRARRLAEQAWEAADKDQLELAGRIIRRAVELDPGNPSIWNDQGLLLRQSNDDHEAAESFQSAICLAPTFSEPYANLAEIRARQGHANQAVVLQREAVRHAPETERYRISLASYEALMDRNHDLPLLPGRAAKAANGESNRAHQSLRLDYPDLISRIESQDWTTIETDLTRFGYARLPRLLSPAECATIRRMFDDDRLCCKTVVMDKPRFGQGVYRYLDAPLPGIVDAIRRLVYPHAARVANKWQGLLQEAEMYPAEWDGFQARCADAAQTTPSILLLRYEAGGFNALHQDLRGEVYFPLQLVIVLSQRSESLKGDGFTGGDFLFCDCPERKKSDRRAVAAGLGDAVLFCTRARLVRIVGIYGLKSVKHGLERVTSGTRYAVGIPFHDFE